MTNHLNKTRNLRSGFWLALLSLTLAGCGSTEETKKDTFFTSGSREADQRASQRMAKAEQLTGGSEKGTKQAKASDGTGEAVKVEGKTSLFDRLGGQQGITAIVEDFTPRLLQDPRVNWNREGIAKGGLLNRDPAVSWKPTPQNVGILKKHMTQFLALATGGPAKYEGKEMKSGHAGMKITNAEFDAAVGDIKASLDKLKIPDGEQKEFLSIIESTRPQVVTER